MEARRDLTSHMIRVMDASTSTSWPGDRWEKISPVLDDMTIDPDVMGLLVFIGCDDCEACDQINTYDPPCVHVELHGCPGWLVLTFNPDMLHDDQGRGARMAWSERICDWVCMTGIHDAPAVRDPGGLVWGWHVVSMDQKLH